MSIDPLFDSTCRGFHWIGQTLESCDNCGRPAREHDGLMSQRRDAPLFSDDGLYIKPWSEVYGNAE